MAIPKGTIRLEYQRCVTMWQDTKRVGTPIFNQWATSNIRWFIIERMWGRSATKFLEAVQFQTRRNSGLQFLIMSFYMLLDIMRMLLLWILSLMTIIVGKSLTKSKILYINNFYESLKYISPILSGSIFYYNIHLSSSKTHIDILGWEPRSMLQHKTSGISFIILP